jgi:hypothetical protein
VKVAEKRDGALAELAAAKAVIAQLKADEAAAAVRPCSPGGPLSAQGLQPMVDGVLRFYLCMVDATYQLLFAGQGPGGKAWQLKKYADGTVRTVTETDKGALECDCQWHREKGQDAKPCRHRRAIKSVKALFATTGPAFRPAPAVKKTLWAVINVEAEDCRAGAA